MPNAPFLLRGAISKDALSRLAAVSAAAIIVCGTGTPVPAAALGQGASPDIKQLVQAAGQQACSSGMDSPPVSGARRNGTTDIRAENATGQVVGWSLPNGLVLRISRVEAQGGGQGQRQQPQRQNQNQQGRQARGGTLYFVDAYRDAGGLVPVFRGVFNGRCDFMGGQDVLYTSGSGNSPYALQQVGPGLDPMKDAVVLNPPVPDGKPNPSCLKVGILDNGVAYTLPEISSRLARDASGKLIGHDYWENDDRPFDYGYPEGSTDPRVSPFSPRHHGTGVASVMLSIAPPSACIAPYRYQPGPARDATDVGPVLDDMDRAGVRIVNLSSGRDQPWPEFKAAIAAHPDILFVFAAGNEGRDIGAKPSYPPSYEAPNVIVVAGANADGSLWDHSNRGPVDLAVVAVQVAATEWDGSQNMATGTSYASPKISGFAARLLALQPNLTPAQLKQAILDLAHRSGVNAGGIPVLTDEQLKGS